MCVRFQLNGFLPELVAARRLTSTTAGVKTKEAGTFPGNDRFRARQAARSGEKHPDVMILLRSTNPVLMAAPQRCMLHIIAKEASCIRHDRTCLRCGLDPVAARCRLCDFDGCRMWN